MSTTTPPLPPRPMPKLVKLAPAFVTKFHDGDTAHFVRSLEGVELVGEYGTGVRCRFAEVYCPELKEPGGPEAAAFTQAWIEAAATPGVRYPLLTQRMGTDPYGRPLLLIWRNRDGACINRDLVAAGHGTFLPLARQLAQE